MAKFPEISHLIFNQLGLHTNVKSRKSLETQAWFITINEEPIRSKIVHEN